MKIFWGLGLGLLLVVAGCGRKVTPSITTEVKDSTYVLEVPRLVTVDIPGRTVKVKEFIRCDSTTNKPIPIRLSASGKTGARQEVEIDSNGLLTATGGCDSLKAVVEARDKQIYRLRQEKTKQTIVVKEFITRPIDKACRVISMIVGGVLIGYTFFKLKKIFP